MPNTVEHKVEMFRLAQERRNAGRPVWDSRLRIKHLLTDDGSDESAHEVGQQIAATLRASSWMKADQRQAEDRLGDSEVQLVAEEFEDIKDLDHFNAVLDTLYDLADADRVWVE